MGLQDGLPWSFILRWTYEQMQQEPGIRYVRLDEAMAQIFFTVQGTQGGERRYRLSIDRGWPRVVQEEGPPDATP